MPDSVTSSSRLPAIPSAGDTQSRIKLWTNDVLTSARRIYEAANFQLVEEEKHHSFGHDLVGQNWQLELH
jgi:hypothetical protein